jgi:membrane fusion protein (multidrug efflux system)
LRIGLSMQVDVDTHEETGVQLGAAVNTSYHTDVFAQYGDEADAEIARIIAQNMPAKHEMAASTAQKNAARKAG